MPDHEAALSGDVARLNELIRIIGTAKSEGKFLAEHKPDAKGRCGKCRSIGCSLYNAAVAVREIRAKHEAEQKLGGSGT